MAELDRDLDIFKAAEQGDAERIAELIARDREQVNGFSADGWTALHLACFYGHAAAVDRLLNGNASTSAYSRNTIANQPLHAAIAGRTSVEIVKMLVARGADVRAAAEQGYTPLHLAASRGSRELVDLLILHGADGSVCTTDGRNAAAIAEEYGHPEVAEYLRSAPDAR